MRVQAIRAVAVLAIATLALGGCTRSKPHASASSSAPLNGGSQDTNGVPYDKVPTGGTLRWAVDALPANLNPYHSGSSSADLRPLRAVLPSLWRFDVGGVPAMNPDVLVRADESSKAPQTIRYRLNSKAVWSDGTPITYKDFAGIWQAERGVDKAYETVPNPGYQRIKSVQRGVTDRDVTVTFAKPFSEWRSLFDPIVPTRLTDTAEHFNSAWKDNTQGVSGGPFEVASLDRAQQTMTLTRNAKWWGGRAKLERIEFTAMTPDAQLSALREGRTDVVDLEADAGRYAAAKKIAGVAVRTAGSLAWRHLDIGRTGPLAEVGVRRAVVLGLDRAGAAVRTFKALGGSPVLSDSHVWVNTQTRYRSTCGEYCRRNVKQARAGLEALGYRKGADGFYARRGTTLTLRFLVESTQEAEARAQQKALKDVGIKVTIQTVPTTASGIPDRVRSGDFDLCLLTTTNPRFPIATSASRYTRTGADNWSKIGSAGVDRLYELAVTQPDEQRGIDLSYQIDQKIWDEAHSVPLFQLPELVAVRSTLVNIGATGLADLVWQEIGIAK